MATRISLDDGPEPPPPLAPRRHRRRQPFGARRPPVADADWDRWRPDALLLLLPGEPVIGARFRYAGVGWEVIGYRDGWIARMLVT